jgi:hypothetical protein
MTDNEIANKIIGIAIEEHNVFTQKSQRIHSELCKDLVCCLVILPRQMRLLINKLNDKNERIAIPISF